MGNSPECQFNHSIRHCRCDFIQVHIGRLRWGAPMNRYRTDDEIRRKTIESTILLLFRQRRRGDPIQLFDIRIRKTERLSMPNYLCTHLSHTLCRRSCLSLFISFIFLWNESVITFECIVRVISSAKYKCAPCIRNQSIAFTQRMRGNWGSEKCRSHIRAFKCPVKFRFTCLSFVVRCRLFAELQYLEFCSHMRQRMQATVTTAMSSSLTCQGHMVERTTNRKRERERKNWTKNRADHNQPIDT